MTVLLGAGFGHGSCDLASGDGGGFDDGGEYDPCEDVLGLGSSAAHNSWMRPRPPCGRRRALVAPGDGWYSDDGPDNLGDICCFAATTPPPPLRCYFLVDGGDGCGAVPGKTGGPSGTPVMNWYCRCWYSVEGPAGP